MFLQFIRLAHSKLTRGTTKAESKLGHFQRCGARQHDELVFFMFISKN